MEHINQNKSVEGEVYKKQAFSKKEKKETKHHVQDSYSEEVPSALSTSINANTISICFYNVS
jgi:putative Mn2+ efflux pump MntP